MAGCPVSLITDFSASINPLGPPQSATRAIQQGLSALRSYPDPNYFQLRSALAKWHDLSPEWILPGNGSAELLTWAGRELAQQDLTYLITPAFSDYGRALKTFSAKVQTCPFDLEREEWENNSSEIKSPLNLLLEREKKNLQNLKSSGLLLNNPHNPTGKLFCREEILPYLEKFALVVIDEAFMDFLPPQEQQSAIASIEDYPNLVIMRSLTKFYSLPGLRLGYAIAHPDRLRRWQQWRDPWSVNILAAMAAEAVIEDKNFQEKTWNWLVPAREKLYRGLASVSGLQPLKGAANFLLVRTERSSSQLQEKLLKTHHLLIRDCLSFPELGDRYFRTAVLCEANNQRLIEGLATINH
jgi:L-threonine-O-3-phosphate decarboxylase